MTIDRDEYDNDDFATKEKIVYRNHHEDGDSMKRPRKPHKADRTKARRAKYGKYEA